MRFPYLDILIQVPHVDASSPVDGGEERWVDRGTVDTIDALRVVVEGVQRGGVVADGPEANRPVEGGGEEHVRKGDGRGGGVSGDARHHGLVPAEGLWTTHTSCR